MQVSRSWAHNLLNSLFSYLTSFHSPNPSHETSSFLLDQKAATYGSTIHLNIQWKTSRSTNNIIQIPVKQLEKKKLVSESCKDVVSTDVGSATDEGHVRCIQGLDANSKDVSSSREKKWSHHVTWHVMFDSKGTNGLTKT